MRGSAARGVASVLGLWAGLACAPGRAQALDPAPGAAVESPGTGPVGPGAVEGSPIARIDVDPHGIFDTLPGGRLAALFRLADRLHVRTRSSTIRNHLLVQPGEPWSEARARESERVLRGLGIFDVVRVEGRPSGDSAVVQVWTRDAWTTSPDFSLERGGGQTFGSVQFSEHNLFGRAQQISVAYREDPTGISRSIEASDPGVDGTRVEVGVGASNGSSGTATSVTVGLPFYAEDTPFSFGFRAERAHTTARLFQGGAEVATFPRRLDRVELSFGAGRRVDGTIARLTGSFLVLDRSFGESAATPGAPVEFTGGEERLRVRRVVAEGRLWRPAFVERYGAERLDGVEDFDLGPSLAVALGYSPRALGANVEDGSMAFRLDAGADGGRAGFGWMRFGLGSRLVAGPRETTLRFEGRWFNQAIPRHTLVVAALGAGGWNQARDFQLVVGGLNGLRAHDVHALAGDQLWRFNAESRWLIGRDFMRLVSLGTAVFWDAARTWGPGSNGAPWQHDVGLGLRVGLPRSALNRVARFDVAWPLSPAQADGREAVFSFGSSQAF